MAGRVRRWRAVVPVLVATVAGGLWQAQAVTSGTAVAQTTPTTRDLLKDLVDGLLPTTTVPPAAGTPAAPGHPAPAKPPPTTAPAPKPTVPANGGPAPDVTGMIFSAARGGGRTTLPLLDALGRLKALGFTDEEAAVIGMGHFPVAGPASYSDDFGAFRAGPPVHAHQGNDIFANRGTPVRAGFDGTVSYGEGGLAGKFAYLNANDGTSYFMAHLDSFVGGGRRVKQGEIIAHVGNTGNAAGGAPHLHFEVHPGGGAAVNPKPFLDRWLDEAIAHVPEILASFNQGVGLPRALTDAGMLRRFDPPRTASASSELKTILLATEQNPQAGARRLAELQAAQAAGRVDGQYVAAVEQALDDAWREGRDLSRAVLAPVTPGPLQPILASKAD